MIAPSLAGLRVKLFADGVDQASLADVARLPLVAGFTTNPTLMRKAGIADYRACAQSLLRLLPGRPISFGVISDDCAAMERQAHEIASWGPHVYVKIPVVTTQGEETHALTRRLAAAGLRVNVTAVMTLAQVRDAADALAQSPASYVSVFAGRIADTGRDPVPLMAAAVELLQPYPHLELIWASPRELLNVFQADAVGCQVITLTPDLLRKLTLVGKDLTQYSIETARMFHEDAISAGYSL